MDDGAIALFARRDRARFIANRTISKRDELELGEFSLAAQKLCAGQNVAICNFCELQSGALENDAPNRCSAELWAMFDFLLASSRPMFAQALEL